MVTFTPLHDGSGRSCKREKGHTTTNPQVNGTCAQMQPTNNPYHWEAPGSSRSNVSTWAKASWFRTNEIVRRGAGASTLKRNTAIRRNGKGRTTQATGAPTMSVSISQTAMIKSDFRHHYRSSCKLKMHRRFSFEDEEQRTRLSFYEEECEEEQAVSLATTLVDAELERDVEAQCTKVHEELDGRPYVPRTFSDILGEPFVPTALVEDEQDHAGSWNTQCPASMASKPKSTHDSSIQ